MKNRAADESILTTVGEEKLISNVKTFYNRRGFTGWVSACTVAHAGDDLQVNDFMALLLESIYNL